MKLNPLDREGLMSHSHDLAFLRPRSHFETVRDGGRFNDERMITRGRQRVRESSKDTFFLVLNGTRLPVHQAFSSDDSCSMSLTD